MTTTGKSSQLRQTGRFGAWAGIMKVSLSGLLDLEGVQASGAADLWRESRPGSRYLLSEREGRLRLDVRLIV